MRKFRLKSLLLLCYVARRRLRCPRTELCGHTHIPRSLELRSEALMVNPGCVGLQAYDDVPFLHKMESGSPHARYAILEKHNGKWSVELRKVSYNWDEAAEVVMADN